MLRHKKKIAVLGLGKSGRSAVKLALKSGYSVCAVDNSDSTNLRNFQNHFAEDKNVKFKLGCNKLKLTDFDKIVISPGIRPDSPLGRSASASGIPIVSELEFGLSFLKIPFLAITGTNGKTTVTEMTAMILQNCGLNAVSIGNIGTPASEVALTETDYNIAVVEASSFQLENSKNLFPLGAALLNIHSDHIDWHKSFTNYFNAKLKIFRNINAEKNTVINYNLINSQLIKSAILTDFLPLTFSYESSDADIYYDSVTNEIHSKFFNSPISIEKLKKFSRHNIENTLAAVALSASAVKDTKKLKPAIIEFIENFKTSPHRQELIAVHKGVKFINDSKSTNPLSLIAAIDATSDKEKSICLIAGGLDKQMDFSDVLKYKNQIKVIFLIGDSKKSLVSLWNDDIHCILCDTLKDAVFRAVDFADSGDVILLSPGCASMDMFENYQERGNVFRDLVLNYIIENKQMQMCSV